MCSFAIVGLQVSSGIPIVGLTGNYLRNGL